LGRHGQGTSPARADADRRANGGHWDHLPPLVVDRWGPELWVPTAIISPFAKKGFVDHTARQTVSFKFIKTR
jgi:phospholipase C